MAFMVLGLYVSALGPALPELKVQLNATVDEMSWAFTGRALGYFIGAVCGGLMYERLPPHHVTAGFMLLAVVGGLLVPLAQRYWLLLLGVIGQGMGMGILDTGGNYVLILTYQEDLGPYMQAIHFGFACGALIGPLLVGAFLPSTSIEASSSALAVSLEHTEHTGVTTLLPSFLIFNICALLVIGSMFFLPPVRRRVATSGALQRRDFLVIGLISAILFFDVGAEVTMGGYLSEYSLVAGFFDNEQAAAFLTSVFWFSLAAGRLASVFVATRLSNQTMLLLDCGGSLAGAVLVWLAQPNLAVLLYLGVALVGLGMASVFPAVFSLAEEYIDVSGKASSLFVCGASLGEMLIPLTAGQLFTRFTPPPLAPVVTLSLVLVTAAYLALRFLGRRKAPPSIDLSDAFEAGPSESTD